MEGDNFSQPFYVVGSNNTWFNLILPTNISRRVSQDEFWNKFSNLTYNLTEHIPWNEFGPEMPHYKEILFDHEGNQINKTFKINLLNSTDKYFHGGADRANFKDLTESIQKQLKYKYIYKPMHPFERLIFNWLYSACNSTSWYPLSVPSNQDSIFNTLPAYKHLNSGSFGSFYTGEYDKCILFYDSSATSELMHYLFSKVASLANQTHSFPDLKFGAINVDLNYAQFMSRNISAPLVMKSRVPFVAVLPQQWYGFKPFIVNDPSKIDTILSKYQGRQRYSHPVNAAPYIFNETLWNPIYYNLLLKKFKFLSKKHTFEKSPSGKSWITNEVFYWSLQF